MGSYAATGHTTWVAGYDMTGDSSKLALKLGAEPQDATVFGNVAHNRVGGLRTVESSVEGWWQAGTGAVDPAVFSNLGGLQVVTHTQSGTVSDVAYMYQAKTLQYEMFGQVGEVVPFSLEAVGARGNGTLSVGAVRGRLLAAKGSISATGAFGTGYQLGAVAADEYLYAAVHCFSVGTTFTIVIESDDNPGFTSATTRMTLGPITTTGGTWGTRVAGAITDTHWRANVTDITGTSSVAVVAGIR